MKKKETEKANEVKERATWLDVSFGLIVLESNTQVSEGAENFLGVEIVGDLEMVLPNMEGPLRLMVEIDKLLSEIEFLVREIEKTRGSDCLLLQRNTRSNGRGRSNQSVGDGSQGRCPHPDAVLSGLDPLEGAQVVASVHISRVAPAGVGSLDRQPKEEPALREDVSTHLGPLVDGMGEQCAVVFSAARLEASASLRRTRPVLGMGLRRLPRRPLC